MRSTTPFTSAILAAALLLAACGGDDASASDGNGGDGGEGGGVTVVATEFSFDPESLALPADEPVELTLDNQGVVEHDIVVEELDDRELVYADGNESVTETVTVPAGTYTFYCSIPGHREGGMEGTLTAE